VGLEFEVELLCGGEGTLSCGTRSATKFGCTAWPGESASVSVWSTDSVRTCSALSGRLASCAVQLTFLRLLATGCVTVG
jgi:hypothetical protein